MKQAGKERASLPRRFCKVEKVCGSFRKYRMGAAVVEFAIVAPIFFLLIFGMIEYGRMVMVQQVLTNASREGARRAVLDGATPDVIRKLVKDYTANAAIRLKNDNIQLTPVSPSNAGYGEPVKVTVTVDFDQVSWLPAPMYLGETTLSASTVMRRESLQ